MSESPFKPGQLVLITTTAVKLKEYGVPLNVANTLVNRRIDCVVRAEGCTIKTEYSDDFWISAHPDFGHFQPHIELNSNMRAALKALEDTKKLEVQLCNLNSAAHVEILTIMHRLWATLGVAVETQIKDRIKN